MSIKSFIDDYVTGNDGQNWEITKASLQENWKEFSSYIRQNPEKAVLALLGGAVGYNAVAPSVAAAQEFSKPQARIVQEHAQSDFDALYDSGWSDKPVNAHIDSLARAFLAKNGLELSGDTPIYLRTFDFEVNGKFSRNLFIYHGNAEVGTANDQDSLFVKIYEEPVIGKDGNFNMNNHVIDRIKIERKY